MTLSVSTAVAIAACNAYTAKCDVGAGAAASFTVYSGAVPANVATALTGANVALVTMVMSAPAFGAAAENVSLAAAESAANAVADKPALATGTATFYRMFDKDGNAIWQGVVTAPNGGGDMELSSVSVIQSVSVVLQSFYFRVPK
jgi:hypothetical protein